MMSSPYRPLARITPPARTCIRLDLPIPVVAKMPTWVARLAPGMPTVRSTTVSPLRSLPTGRSPIRWPGRRNPPASGPPPPRTGWAGSWVCGTPIAARPACRPGPDTRDSGSGHPVGAPGLLVEGMGAGLAPLVVGQQRPRHPFRPARFPVLAAIGHVHHPEDVPAAGRLVHADQQLADEQVLVRGGPEHPFQHVPAEQPASEAGASVTWPVVARRRSTQYRSIRRWRSAKARSCTSGGTPARSSRPDAGPILRPGPTRAGRQAVDDAQRVGVAGEGGVVGQRRQGAEHRPGFGDRPAGPPGTRTGRRDRAGPPRPGSRGRRPVGSVATGAHHRPGRRGPLGLPFQLAEQRAPHPMPATSAWSPRRGRRPRSAAACQQLGQPGRGDAASRAADRRRPGPGRPGRPAPRIGHHLAIRPSPGAG